MKIAYIAHIDMKRDSGVRKKVAGQVQVWKEEGHEVKLFVLSPIDVPWIGMDGILAEVFLFPRGLIRRFLVVERLIQRVIAWMPDLIYHRFNRFYPSLEAAMSRYPAILELVSDDIGQVKAHSSRLAYLYHRATRGRILRKVQGIVAMGHEIADKAAHYKKPMVLIGSSVDLSRYPFPQVPHNSNPRLVFIGAQPALWHGLDKIPLLARQFPSWRFDIIGLFGQADIPLPVPSNMVLHGHLDDYRNIMLQADVAIGTLALHRKGMNETTALKVPEYLAYGLPVILGYRDSSVPPEAPYVLQLPNTETNVADSLPAIEQFVEKWKGKRVPRTEILHLDVHEKEKQRLRFFEQILSKWNSP
jgi:hypothetical protein